MGVVIPGLDVGVIAPLLIVVVAGLVVLVLGLVVREGQRGYLGYVGLAGTVLALAACLPLWGASRSAFGGMLVADRLFVFFAVLSLVITALAVLLSLRSVAGEGALAGEYYALLLFSAAGMLLVVSSADLIVLFLGLEVLSLALYVLAGFIRGWTPGQESALKYFLLGSFSLGFLVYGTALVYGATGTTSFAKLSQQLTNAAILDSPVLLVGVGLLLVGFAFKLAFVPFHMWTPDVYEGAPTAVTAFMAVGTKAAVFAALVRLLAVALPALQPQWGVILWALAILTMVVGNIAAIAQSNIKRMLAYSSIAHAGYVLVAVVASNAAGWMGAVFYLAAYAFMNLGAFAVVAAWGEGAEKKLDLSDYAGLAGRKPLLAAAMATFMLALAGVPPTAGFMAKLYVFSAAVQGGLIDLALVGVLTSAIAAYYYLRVIVIMYMREPVGEAAAGALPAPWGLVLFITALATWLMGLFPAPVVGLAQGLLAQVLGL